MRPKSKEWCPYKNTQRYTKRGWPCERERWGVMTLITSQRMSRTASNHKKLGEKNGTDLPSEPPGETNLADTLILEFWFPELLGNKLLLS